MRNKIYIYKIINDIPKFDHLVYLGATTSNLESKLNMFYNKSKSFNPNKNCFNLFYQLINDYGIRHFEIKCIEEHENINSHELLISLNKYWMRCGSLNNLIDNYRKEYYKKISCH